MRRQEVERAGELIRAGRLVAFPTETVYGLGANALDENAVKRIYEVKQRPAESPLIVHVCSVEMARSLARAWPEEAEKLARAFWPGPLTLVVPKQPSIPDVVTAGLGTVGLRMPAHRLALELIRAAKVPVAAPSANRFSGLSPTTAEHVRAALGGSVDLILDGGATQVGIESTVLTLAAGAPRILRPGMIARQEIEAVVGPVGWGATGADDLKASPGMHARHYSPRTRLVLVDGGRLPASGRGVYLYWRQPAGEHSIAMPDTPAGYAAVLYATLHELDEAGWDWIAVERPPADPAWDGIRDRLQRAAAQ